MEDLYDPEIVSNDYDNPILRLAGDKSSGDPEKLLRGNLGLPIVSVSPGQSLQDANNINPRIVSSGINEENKAAQIREEPSRRANGINNSKLPPISERTEHETLNYNEPKFNEEIKGEIENLEILLKDLYSGADPKEVLSDQEMNEENLKKFFQKYPQSKTDAFAVMLAGFYLALGDLKSAKEYLAGIRDPDIIDDDIQNATYHRAYYIMQANLEINENNFKKARELLKKCWNIQQKYFSNGSENYLDFYATSMGRIYLKEGNLKEAEKCFNDALALRLFSKNSRLISSSYNDLALLYIEKKSEQALQYVKKASEYDMIFKEEVKNNKYNILSGQVDFKRPDLAKTQEASQKLQRPE